MLSRQCPLPRPRQSADTQSHRGLPPACSECHQGLAAARPSTCVRGRSVGGGGDGGRGVKEVEDVESEEEVMKV